MKGKQSETKKQQKKQEAVQSSKFKKGNIVGDICKYVDMNASKHTIWEDVQPIVKKLPNWARILKRISIYKKMSKLQHGYYL